MKTRDAPPAPPARSSSATTSKGSRKPSPAEQALVDRFRAVLATGGQTDATGEEEVAAGEVELPTPASSKRFDDDSPSGRGRGSTTPDTGDAPGLTVGALAGQTVNTAQPPAMLAQGGAAAPAFNPAVLAQLLEKHVRQLLVSSPESATGQPMQVMLNLTDAALPGTQIMLAQTERGWQLKSQTSSDNAYRTMQALAPQLKERFAERGLGDLDLEIGLTDSAHEHTG